MDLIISKYRYEQTTAQFVQNDQRLNAIMLLLFVCNNVKGAN